jgi:hypothetical protein
MTEPSIDAVDRALFADRSLVRLLAMRRTVFAAPVEDAPILHASASPVVVRGERRRTEQLVAQLGVDDVRRWIREAEATTLAALERLGEATARELVAEVPALAARVRTNVGTRYEGTIGIGSQLLVLLAAHGRVVRTRPRGTWLSTQFRWALMDRWLGRPLPQLPADEAHAALVRLWLGRFGPGTETDIRWWTGLSAREVRAALARLAAIEVALDGRAGFVLAEDLDPTTPPTPWVALLPPLDPTTMGWKERDWYLAEYAARLVDSAGNAGATVWVNGRIVGGWAVRPTGEVLTLLFEDVGGEAAGMVEAEAARLAAWLQTLPSVPRFVTAVQKELVG